MNILSFSGVFGGSGNELIHSVSLLHLLALCTPSITGILPVEVKCKPCFRAEVRLLWDKQVQNICEDLFFSLFISSLQIPAESFLNRLKKQQHRLEKTAERAMTANITFCHCLFYPNLQLSDKLCSFGDKLCQVTIRHLLE